MGTLTSVTDPNGAVTSVSQTSYGLAAAWRIAYHTDANGHLTARLTDGFGRLASVLEYAGNGGGEGGYTPYAQTWYTASPLDLLTRVDDALGNATTMTYDSLGRKTAMSDPAMGAWSYAYDVAGHLTSQTDARGQTITFAYDWLGRLTSKTYPGGARATYTYDEAASSNGRGRRTSMATAAATTRWHYDGRGRTTSTVHTVAALGASRTVQRSYDSADRLTTLAYPSQHDEAVTYTYDAAWRPSSACTAFGGCSVTSATYSALDQPLTRVHPNGVSQQWTSTSPMARLNTLAVVGPGAAVPLSRTYGYDTVGNVTSIADNVLGQTEWFSHDHRDRLTRGWTTGSASGAYDEGYSYDALGNLTARPGWTLTWNYDNQPTSIGSPSGTESYAYDADGARVTRTAGGVTTVYGTLKE